ncbi:tail fiber assembly protein [Glaciimonas sp. Gout2]|uniref:tail fiber assembly protein n=1 Tax=unclassified Glaciimonas TaxID=2644401 RepID=UPI002B237C1C|nr:MULTISPECIES: tail fiber assembly protein [unclassified Glaciimonas]MEB0012577.1 tail fiber assembly protein [Glaciimonas sp. Cout2]MEB0083928.1 tail fiber assembly protein [Glaciimonas sp. Gout2]
MAKGRMMATRNKVIKTNKNAIATAMPDEATSPASIVPLALPVDRFTYADVRTPVRQANGIRCDVKFDANENYWSFLATPDDVEPHGRVIYAECNSGRWGPVPDYYPSDAELIATAIERISNGLRIATTAITKYQDRVDIDDTTPADSALLKAWKTYRVGLNRIIDQPDYPHRLTWPVCPDVISF